MKLALAVLLLAACNPPLPEDSKPVRDDTGPTDTDTRPAATTWNWVVAELTLASGLDGFDLDGDGDKDNALAPLGAVIDPTLAAALDGSDKVILLQLAAAESLVDDSAVRVAVLGGTDLDTDHDPADNFSGTEAFDAGSAVDGQGNAVDFNEVALSGGTYTAVFPPRDVQIGSAELTATTESHLSGRSVSEDNQVGLYGFGVSVASLVAFGKNLGLEAGDLDRLAALADIDTDGDGDDDTVSAAYEFQAVACTLN